LLSKKISRLDPQRSREAVHYINSRSVDGPFQRADV